MAIVIGPSERIRITPSEMVRVEPSQVIKAVPAKPIRVTPIKVVQVQPPRRGAWDERGWTRRNDGSKELYEGHYQVGTRRFYGRVEKERKGKITAFIHNPPSEIRRHRHHACFQQVGVGTGWFLLHWRRSPRDVDGAILYMEQVLDESFNR
jgi:hypothetical protein